MSDVNIDISNGDDDTYDIFISYSHKDNREGGINKLIKKLEVEYQGITGRTPKIFFDETEISTSKIWEKQIQKSLKNSSVMVAMLSASYFKSKFCGQEWDYFIALEKQKRLSENLQQEQGLIFPIKLRDWRLIERVDEKEQKRIDAAESRQYTNLEASIIPDRSSAQYEAQYDKLIQKLIQKLALEIVTLIRAMPVLTSLPNSLPAPHTPELITRIGSNREQFIERLSQANQVIIVGITHKSLVEHLKVALDRMRSQEGQEAFWQQIRIVFLSETMLSMIEDELLSRYQNRDQASLQRTANASSARRVLYRFFSRLDVPEHWSLYEYDAMLPFLGAVFELREGQKVVQVATLRPGFSTSDHLFFEFSGMPGDIAYYQAAFDEVVKRSQKHDETVLVGYPQSPNERGFICSHSKLLSGLAMPGSNSDEWVPAVVILLWHEEQGGARPLLQIRARENSTRELDMLSNLSGYINTQDLEQSGGLINRHFLLPEISYKNTVNREIKEELGVKDIQWGEPELVGEFCYYSADRENLYFYVLSVKLEMPIARIQKSALLQSWPFPDILQIRKHQVLIKALHLLKIDVSPSTQFQVAAEVLANNLILHDEPALANMVMQDRYKRRDILQIEIENLVKQTQKTYSYDNDIYPIFGLAGLQYREFFNTLAPVYQQLGVSGANDFLDAIHADEKKQESLKCLREHYQSPEAILKVQIDV